MKKLDANWVTAGLLDFEYKKYILLAYLKQVEQAFDKGKLYPFMADLVFHYNNLLTLKQNKEILHNEMPKSISQLDFEKLKVVYERIVLDDEVMEEIFAVVQYALPRIKHLLGEGKELYELVEHSMEFEPVGLVPLYKKEGYLFLTADFNREVLIFRYTISALQRMDEQYMAINMQYLKRENTSITNTLPQMKLNMLKQFTDLPNPATYMLYSKLQFPLQATLLPIAKRLLLKHASV